MNCIACHENAFRNLPELATIVRPAFKDVSIVQCKLCGLGLLEPMPTESSITAIYESPEYAQAYDVAGEAFVISNSDEAGSLKDRFDFLASLLPTKGLLLDVGASRGIFLAAAAAKGWRTQGIEVSADAIQYAKRTYGVSIDCGTLEHSHLNDSQFDCVHMSHVLEHMRDPVANLKKVAQSLRPGGVLCVEVPQEFGDLFDRIRAWFLGRPRATNIVPSTHLYFFTIKSLTKIIEQTGLRLVRIGTLRRNQSYESRLPGGVLIKGAVYAAEQMLHQGPMIELYAQKPQ